MLIYKPFYFSKCKIHLLEQYSSRRLKKIVKKSIFWKNINIIKSLSRYYEIIIKIGIILE